DVRTYQLVFGLDGALQNDWTWEFYVSDGTSLIDNEYVGTTSTQRWRYVINQPNYGAGLFAQGNAEGDGFGAGSLSCTSGFSTSVRASDTISKRPATRPSCRAKTASRPPERASRRRAR